MANILLAEDEPHIIRIMHMWLARHGHDVIDSANGAQALAYLRNHPVDLLITDMNMPEMDGLQLVRTVRGELDMSMPVILLSARCDQSELLQQLAGLNVNLRAKPFTPSRLVDDISRLLDSHPSSMKSECAD